MNNLYSVAQKMVFPALLVLSVLLGYNLALSRPAATSTIATKVAPHGSRLTIDSKGVDEGNTAVIPGRHIVVASHKNFKTKSKTVIVKDGATGYAGFILDPVSFNTTDWYNDHPDDQKAAEGVSDFLSDYSTQAALNNNSLLQLLPTSFGDRGDTVTINSGVPVPGSSQPAIYIDAPTPELRREALEWIKNRGYNISTMDIVFNQETDLNISGVTGGSE